MYRYIDPYDDFFLQNDETFQRIREQLAPFHFQFEIRGGQTIDVKMLSNKESQIP